MKDLNVGPMFDFMTSFLCSQRGNSHKAKGEIRMKG